MKVMTVCETSYHLTCSFHESPELEAAILSKYCIQFKTCGKLLEKYKSQTAIKAME